MFYAFRNARLAASGAKRPCGEPTITLEAKAWLTSLSCRKAKELGYPHELWTTRLLARHACEHGPAEGHPCLVIQNSQNRDSAAIQVKLDELIRVSTAQNSFVGIEHLTDEELENIRKTCESRAAAEEEGDEAVKRTGRKARKAADKIAS